MDLNKQTVKALLGVACGSIAFAAALLHLSTVAGAVVWLLGVLAPLLLGCGQGENFLASDVTALLPYTRDVIYMDDGELAVITASGIRLYDERRRPMEKPHNHIDWESAANELLHDYTNIDIGGETYLVRC